MNDETIITAIRAGSEEAIAHVITKYSRLLWSIAAPILSSASEQDVEECVADVFIHLWRNADKYDPARGRLKVWLSVLARTKALDRRRALTRREDLPLNDALPAGSPGILDDLLVQEGKHTLDAAIDALNEPEREILVRRYYYDQKPREIARALDLPVKGVENHLYRTKCRLREVLTPYRTEV